MRVTFADGDAKEDGAMCCEVISARDKGKRSTVRLMALAACVLFIAAMLLSSSYIITHANHTHDGPSGGCATCMHIQAAENLLKRLSAAIVTVAVVFGGLSGLLFFLKACAPCFGFLSLVILKVRLNN